MMAHTHGRAVGPMRIVVLCPHFAPDTAPTGVVMTAIVDELVALGNTVHVVTALPWYRKHRVEEGWRGHVVRRDPTPWGSITRVTPFAGADKTNLVRRALGFVGFSVLAGFAGLSAGGWFSKADAVIAMSPPLTMGLTGWMVALAHRAKLVFNIQDVFPDALVESGALDRLGAAGTMLVRAARRLERVSYHRADAVTVLSEDLADNVAAKVAPAHRSKVRVIPNFARTDAISPADRMTDYRRELGLGDEPVVLYAGNVGFSQSLDLVIEAARRLPNLSFVINGEGAARSFVDAAAAEIDNLHVRDYQPEARLSEVLATGDIHVVPLKAGLGAVSVPSKTYSSLAAGRPVVAAIDAGTAIPELLERSGGGVSVAPESVDDFVDQITALADDPQLRTDLGAAGYRWVSEHASPAAIGAAYHTLLADLAEGVSPEVPD